MINFSSFSYEKKIHQSRNYDKTELKNPSKKQKHPKIQDIIKMKCSPSLLSTPVLRPHPEDLIYFEFPFQNFKQLKFKTSQELVS